MPCKPQKKIPSCKTGFEMLYDSTISLIPLTTCAVSLPASKKVNIWEFHNIYAKILRASSTMGCIFNT